jgi:minimal PKS acyl carrier protein
MAHVLTYEELAALMKSSAGVTVDPRTLEASPDTPFSEHGLDSLGMLGIIAEIENRHGTSVSGDADGCTTPRAFLAAVNEAPATGV